MNVCLVAWYLERSRLRVLSMPTTSKKPTCSSTSSLVLAYSLVPGLICTLIMLDPSMVKWFWLLGMHILNRLKQFWQMVQHPKLWLKSYNSRSLNLIFQSVLFHIMAPVSRAMSSRNFRRGMESTTLFLLLTIWPPMAWPSGQYKWWREVFAKWPKDQCELGLLPICFIIRLTA